jgi:hypothetical protein
MPYTVPVHPGDASQLALDSATLLLLDAPADLVFGIDCMVLLFRFVFVTLWARFCFARHCAVPKPHLHLARSGDGMSVRSPS